MSDEDGARLSSGTWHYGLIARWWAEVNRPEVAEIAYLRAAIARFGEPALDLGCGLLCTYYLPGRLCEMLEGAGLADVDGRGAVRPSRSARQRRARRHRRRHRPPGIVNRATSPAICRLPRARRATTGRCSSAATRTRCRSRPSRTALEVLVANGVDVRGRLRPTATRPRPRSRTRS